MKLKQILTYSSAGVLCLGALSLFNACSSSNGGGKMGDDEFAVRTLTAAVSEQTTTYPATIRGFQDIEIRPQVSGFIVKLCVDEGAVVRKGQALFQIDPTQYAAAANQAKANVESAKADLKTEELTAKNKAMLFEKKVISEYDYQTALNKLATAKATLAQAEAGLVAAQQNLNFCTVTSPSNGLVGEFPYRVGSLVSPSISEPMTTVSEIDDVYVYFSIPEKQVLEMTKTGVSLKEQLAGMPNVKLELSDETMYQHEGRIDALTGVVDPSTGSVQMRAIFPNKDKVLRSGSWCNIVFPYTMDNILLVPQSATQDIQDKKFVYVLQADNTLKHTEIEVSNLNDGKNYIVTGGLKVGDKIVVEGVQTLKDGQKITPITEAQKEAKYQQAVKDQKEGNLSTAFN